MKKALKKALKIIAIILAIILLIGVGYIAYVFIAYHRIGNAEIPAQGEASGVFTTGKEYSILSYNIGFGAYTADYDFFMDGGTQSWAVSKEALDANLWNIAGVVKAQMANINFIQEVDIGSTRSYNVDERTYLTDALPGMSYTFTQNYDSPFLMFPITKPHGASKSGIMTFSMAPISSAERIELPVESGFMKFLDLDRCYSKNRVPVEDGKDLVLYNFHLSAYTSDGKIATEQLKIIIDDIQKEYEAGNYVIAGGDFNKDLLGDSSFYFGKSDKEYTWAQPLPEGIFDGYNITLVAPIDKKQPVPSCRNADSAYHPGQYVLTIDGFMVSDNVTVVSSKVIDTGFAYSDHNPVNMRFVLGEKKD